MIAALLGVGTVPPPVCARATTIVALLALLWAVGVLWVIGTLYEDLDDAERDEEVGRE